MRWDCDGVNAPWHYPLGIIEVIDLSMLIGSVVLACLITLGWCFLFTLPRQYIVICMMMTVLGFGIKSILGGLNVHLMISTFCGATSASFMGVYFAKRYLLTPKALIVPSIICLMPGIAAYKAMVSMVQIGYFGFSIPLFYTMMSHFFEAIFIISALVLGISIPGLLFYRKRPIV